MESNDLDIEFEKNPIRYWLAGVLITAFVGAFQFVVSLLICIFNYPAKHDPENSGYFISELGRSVLPLSGLFNGSLILFGLMLVPVFVMLVIVDSRDSTSLRFAAGFGILSAVGLIWLGMSPIDRSFFSHLLATGLWLFPMLHMVIAFYYSAVRNPYVSFWFIGSSLVMAVVMLIVFFRSDATDLKLIQRMLVICGGVWLSFILWYLGVTGYAEISQWEPSAQERIDRASETYVESLSKKKTTYGS